MYSSLNNNMYGRFTVSMGIDTYSPGDLKNSPFIDSIILETSINGNMGECCLRIPGTKSTCNIRQCTNGLTELAGLVIAHAAEIAGRDQTSTSHVSTAIDIRSWLRYQPGNCCHSPGNHLDCRHHPSNQPTPPPSLNQQHHPPLNITPLSTPPPPPPPTDRQHAS